MTKFFLFHDVYSFILSLTGKSVLEDSYCWLSKCYLPPFLSIWLLHSQLQGVDLGSFGAWSTRKVCIFLFLCSLLFEDSLKKLLFYWPKKICWRGTRVEALVTCSTKKKIELRAHGFHRSPPLCMLMLLVSSLQNSFYRWTSFQHITAEIELYEIPLWHKVLT